MATYTFSPIDDPLATITIGTIPLGINDMGQVVGVYADISSSLMAHGFLYSGGTYTPLNAPGAAMGTEAFDINNLGQIVGYYTDSNNDEHGFLYSSSTFTYTPLNDPFATGGTQAHGINDGGIVVGQYSDSTGKDHGFIYGSGTYLTLDTPLGTKGTQAYGINDALQIVGEYTDSNDNQHGFLYSGGTYTTLDGPSGAQVAFVFGINDLGQVIGYYLDSSNSVREFLYSGGIYVTLDVGTNSSLPYFGIDINDAGQIVENYYNSGAFHGVLATPPTATTYTFSTLNAPSGTKGTQAYGINGVGQIVGGYEASSGPDHGFLYSSSNFTYTTRDDPLGTKGTEPHGINDVVQTGPSQIVGLYFDSSGTEHGFSYNGSTYTPLNDPSGTNGTGAYGLNDAGQIVGVYYDSSVTAHGFLYNGSNYTTLDGPSGNTGTIARGINDAGQIVGYYFDSNGNSHGFLNSGFTFTTLDDPLGTEGTNANGINDADQIVGVYYDSSGTSHGFLYSGGTYTTLDDPLGAKGTIALGINDAGQIAGVYLDSSGAERGFLANPSPTTITPPTSVQQETLGLYAALYNRAADFFGYSYWVGIDGQQSDSGGVTVANANTTAVTLKDAGVLGQAFVNTQNTFFNQTYGSLTDNAFVDALYVNIGGNAGDPGGVAYWQGLLQQAEAGGQSVQAARAGLAGQFVHDLIGINLAAVTGLTPDQLLAAEQRQEGVNNKIAVSLAYLNASQQPSGSILNAHSVGDDAFNASVAVMQGVTSDPTTVIAAVVGINSAVTQHDLTLI